VPHSDPIFDHERLELPPTLDYAPEQVIAVVVGAHPQAEIADRPWAGRTGYTREDAARAR